MADSFSIVGDLRDRLHHVFVTPQFVGASPASLSLSVAAFIHAILRCVTEFTFTTLAIVALNLPMLGHRCTEQPF